MTNGGERSNISDVRDEIGESGSEETQDIEVEKNFKKSEKKVLTKRKSCGILQKLSRKTTAKHLENYIVHQQTSQVNSDRKIENNGREKKHDQAKKVSKTLRGV